jgi:hypothetical protein
MATYKQYTQTLLLCLGTYQFIEEGLRSCLVRIHATTQFRLEGFFPYEVPLNAIDDAALGRLIDSFKTYTNNADLIKDLHAIKGARDRIAHRGLLLSLEQQVDEAYLDEQIAELKEADARAEDCLKRVLKEWESAENAVTRAYEALKAESTAAGTKPPPPFSDEAIEAAR